MELALIVAGLPAAVAGLAVAVAHVLIAVAVHRHDLAAAGRRPRARAAAACQMRAAGRPDLIQGRARVALQLLGGGGAVRHRAGCGGNGHGGGGCHGRRRSGSAGPAGRGLRCRSSQRRADRGDTRGQRCRRPGRPRGGHGGGRRAGRRPVAELGASCGGGRDDSGQRGAGGGVQAGARPAPASAGRCRGRGGRLRVPVRACRGCCGGARRAGLPGHGATQVLGRPGRDLGRSGGAGRPCRRLPRGRPMWSDHRSARSATVRGRASSHARRAGPCSASSATLRARLAGTSKPGTRWPAGVTARCP